MPKAQETLSKLGSCKILSKLDKNCGYWQMKLHSEAQMLTLFITIFKRYFCSALEIFQKEMQKILRGVYGILCQINDIMVHESDIKQHNRRLRKVLSKSQLAEVTLNDTMCEFNKKSVQGIVIDEIGF